MRIVDILNSERLSLSFEVFPPKADSSFESVRTATEQIAALHPSFMSVTYGAGGGTSRYTLDIAKNIMAGYGVPTLAHLTCVSSTKQTVLDRLSEFCAAGVDTVMALRGDLPADGAALPRHYTHAVELIREIKTHAPQLSIGAACYPEVHPESKSQREDLYHLKEKVEAGCDFLTTQMFFDNNLFYSFLYRLRECGITVPVVAGIMPITGQNQIQRAQQLSGSFMPRRFLSLVDRFGDNASAMMQAGIAYATDQIIDLYANGVRHVHVYSMNKPEVAQRITQNLSEILKA